MFQMAGLDHIALTVRDQNISLEWYQRVLGMERRYEEAKGADDPVFVALNLFFLLGNRKVRDAQHARKACGIPDAI